MMSKKYLVALTAVMLSTAVVTAAPKRVNSNTKAKGKAAVEKVTAAELATKIADEIRAYDFESARANLEKYNDTKGASEEKASKLEDRIILGSSMLERVQKIAVIDSITVDKADFFKAYNLNPAAGSLEPASMLPEGFPAAAETAVYTTESGDHIYWGAPADNGGIRIVSSALLADGSWETPAGLEGAVNGEGSSRSNYPFVMADGITLYFASDDPATSLGGYDIFITRFDGEKYLEPQNVGMPFNSAADDYLLAIDETTGAGWWATDRNNLGDKLTVYVYVPTEMRVNYPTDTPGIVGLAKLTDIKATQDPEADYSALLNTIASPMKREHAATEDFEFALPDGSIVRTLDDFRSERARQAMESYLDRTGDLNILLEDLADMRAEYADGDDSLRAEILRAEKEELRIRSDIRRLAAAIVDAEMRSR